MNKKRFNNIFCCGCNSRSSSYLVIFNNKNKIKVTLCPIQEVKEKFDEDLTELKENRYDNLIYNDFITTFPDVEALYDLEIETDNAYLNRTTLENFHIMQDAINKFFKEDFDKSYIDAEFIFHMKTVEQNILIIMM